MFCVNKPFRKQYTARCRSSNTEYGGKGCLRLGTYLDRLPDGAVHELLDLLELSVQRPLLSLLKL